MTAIRQGWTLTPFHEGLLTSSVQAGFVAGTLTSALLSAADRYDLRILFATSHSVAEGAGAAAVAALLQERDRMAGRAVAVVVTGGNVDSDVFARVLASGRD